MHALLGKLGLNALEARLSSLYHRCVNKDVIDGYVLRMTFSGQKELISIQTTGSYFL